MSPNDSCLTREKILQYLKKELDPEELAMTETHLSRCELCESAVEGIGLYLDNHSSEMLDKSLSELEVRIRERRNREASGKVQRGMGEEIPGRNPGISWFASRRMWTVMGIAASILILLGTGAVINYMVKQRNLQISQAEKLQKVERKKDRTTVQYLPAPEDLIFNDVEEAPAFPGGDEAMGKFLTENITCPSDPDGLTARTSLFVHFVVEEDGSVSNVRLVREMGKGCADEVIRGIESMPRWTPGKQGGETVRVGYILMLKFS